MPKLVQMKLTYTLLKKVCKGIARRGDYMVFIILDLKLVKIEVYREYMGYYEFLFKRVL